MDQLRWKTSANSSWLVSAPFRRVGPRFRPIASARLRPASLPVLPAAPGPWASPNAEGGGPLAKRYGRPAVVRPALRVKPVRERPVLRGRLAGLGLVEVLEEDHRAEAGR